MKLVRSANGQSFVFDRTAIQLVSYNKTDPSFPVDSWREQLTAWINEHFAELKQLEFPTYDYPSDLVDRHPDDRNRPDQADPLRTTSPDDRKVFARLEQVAMAVAFARFLYDNNIPIDFSPIDTYQIPVRNTPTRTVGTPLQATWTYEYDSTTGQLVQEKDPTGVVTRYEYDSRGNLTRVIVAPGTPAEMATTHTYDAFSRRISTQDALGRVTNYAYNGRDQLVATTLVGPQPITFTSTFDPATGRKLTDTKPNGNTTSYTYDATTGDLIQVNENGTISRLVYDRFGDVAAVVDPVANRTVFERDAIGRLVRVASLLSDIKVLEPKAAGNTAMTVKYEIVGGPIVPFDIGFYRSADPTWGGTATLLATMPINALDDLTAGIHVKTFTIGSGAGSVPLPGAGVAEPGVDYYILIVADPRNVLVEQDASDWNEDNTLQLVGAYHPPAGGVFVHGAAGNDTITVAANSLWGAAGVAVITSWRRLRIELPPGNAAV